MTTRHIEFEINGRALAADVEPRMLLSDFIRHELNLTGTHVGCEQGGCGACTVQLDGQPVRSCLVFAVQADGCSIRTVEALTDGLPSGEMHPLQDAFRETHGLQCGFCTPGILMSMEPLLLRDELCDEADVRAALGGNICRCTGYQGIVDALLLARQRTSDEPDDAERVDE